jgi:hypothetical protein
MLKNYTTQNEKIAVNRTVPFSLFLVYSENGYTKGRKQRMEKNGILESFSKYFAEKPYTGIRKHALKFF